MIMSLSVLINQFTPEKMRSMPVIGIFIYFLGAVLVGSVDGNRIWGKELKGSKVVAVLCGHLIPDYCCLVWIMKKFIFMIIQGAS